MPQVRRSVYAPVAGIVGEVLVDHAMATEVGTPLARMSSIELDRQQIEVAGQLKEKDQERQSLEEQKKEARKVDPQLEGRLTLVKTEIRGLLTQQTQLDEERKKLEIRSPIRGSVMDWKPKEKLLNRPVQMGDPLLEVADIDGRWVLEVDLPENAITHITRAEREFDHPLDVEFVLSSDPETTYKGKLLEHATQAHPVEQENFIEAKVELNEDDKLAQLLREAASREDENAALVSGIEVRAKVNCGDYPLGYVLFRELIDFVREYVFF